MGPRGCHEAAQKFIYRNPPTKSTHDLLVDPRPVGGCRGSRMDLPCISQLSDPTQELLAWLTDLPMVRGWGFVTESSKLVILF